MKGYRLVLASDVDERDGMALELSTESGEQLAEVFEDDATGNRTVRFFSDSSIPLDVVDWFLAKARESL
jgi:hypothetical protein